MGFLQAAKGLHNLKLPLASKERTLALSYELVQRWSRGEDGV